MPRQVWTLVCDRAITDSESNNVSLINIIEQLNVSKEACKTLLEGDDEVVHIEHHHVVCSLWVREDDEDPNFDVRVEFKSPEGVVLGGATAEVDLSDKPRTRTMFNSRGFPIVGEGIYEFVVESRQSESDSWGECARVPIHVRYHPVTS